MVGFIIIITITIITSNMDKSNFTLHPMIIYTYLYIRSANPRVKLRVIFPQLKFTSLMTKKRHYL